MITPVFQKETTIDEMLSLEDLVEKNLPKKRQLSTDKEKKVWKQVAIGGTAIVWLLTAPVASEANIQSKHEVISYEAVSNITEKADNFFWGIKKDVELINKANLLDLDSLIDGDEIREEMEIISDYMKKAKDIYAFCNEEFTL